MVIDWIGLFSFLLFNDQFQVFKQWQRSWEGNERLEGALRQPFGPPTFYVAVQEWSQGNERFRTRLQHQIPLSSPEDENIDDVIGLTKAYQKHKVDYMKHMSFNPEGENLSKYIFDDG